MARWNLFILSSFHWSHSSEKALATGVTEAICALSLWLMCYAVTNASHHVEGSPSYIRPKSNGLSGVGSAQSSEPAATYTSGSGKHRTNVRLPLFLAFKAPLGISTCCISHVRISQIARQRAVRVCTLSTRAHDCDLTKTSNLPFGFIS